MALGTPVAPAIRVSSNGGSSITSVPFTPTSNSLLFAHLATRDNNTLPAPTVGDNAALSWFLLTDEYYDILSGTRVRQRVYCAPIGTAPLSMTVSLTTNATGVRSNLQTLLLSGSVTVPSNYDSGQHVAGDPSTTLPGAPLSTSMLLSFFAGSETSTFAVSPPAGFTAEVEDSFSTEGNMQMQTAYQSTGGATTNSWSTLGAPSCAAVIEVRAPMTTRSSAIWTG